MQNARPNPQAPLDQWVQWRAYDSARECEGARTEQLARLQRLQAQRDQVTKRAAKTPPQVGPTPADSSASANGPSAEEITLHPVEPTPAGTGGSASRTGIVGPIANGRISADDIIRGLLSSGGRGLAGEPPRGGFGATPRRCRRRRMIAGSSRAFPTAVVGTSSRTRRWTWRTANLMRSAYVTLFSYEPYISNGRVSA
jgi:hypothetical protein